MKKILKNSMKITSLIFVLSLCSFIFAQENEMQDIREIQESNTTKHIKHDNIAEDEHEESEYILTPSLGYSSLGVTTGLDFMYRMQNGFAVLVNLNFSVPPINLGGAIFSSECYLGYTLKKNKFYVSFLAGTWLGGGAYFVAWNNSPSRKDFMNGHLQTVPSLMITFALRGDFTYFFNDKLGLQFSHAHGFGLLTHAVAMDRRMYPQDLTHYYSFMLKLGLAIKV